MKKQTENILAVFMLLGLIGICYDFYKISIRKDEVSSLINMVVMGIGMIIIAYSVKRERQLHNLESGSGKQ